jgi:hypothetical protein
MSVAMRSIVPRSLVMRDHLLSAALIATQAVRCTDGRALVTRTFGLSWMMRGRTMLTYAWTAFSGWFAP